jgi:hypothetical protein
MKISFNFFCEIEEIFCFVEFKAKTGNNFCRFSKKIRKQLKTGRNK